MTNFYSILQKYKKLEQLNSDFLSLDFPEEQYCISLSGGVDSMVLIDLLIKKHKKIIAIHINYNNRSETGLEEQFLREYCEKNSVKFICHIFDITRGSIKRNKYEEMTKKIKFSLYKKVLIENNINHVLLAHHKDDIIENIYTNFCTGRNFLDLSVIKYENTIFGVNIVRPLLSYYKSDIYNYAHFFGINYFLDTTPEWSVRGILRGQLFPLISTTFNGYKQNLLNISHESEEWSELLNTKIIKKYYENIVCNENNAILPLELNNENYSKYPLCFWKEIFVRLYHSYGICAPSRKSLILFRELLINNITKNMILSKNTKARLFSNNITIQFYNDRIRI